MGNFPTEGLVGFILFVLGIYFWRVLGSRDVTDPQKVKSAIEVAERLGTSHWVVVRCDRSDDGSWCAIDLYDRFDPHFHVTLILIYPDPNLEETRDVSSGDQLTFDYLPQPTGRVSLESPSAYSVMRRVRHVQRV